MSRALRVLIIGALTESIARFTNDLQQQGFDLFVAQVDTLSDLTVALENASWDIAVSSQGKLLHITTEGLPDLTPSTVLKILQNHLHSSRFAVACESAIEDVLLTTSPAPGVGETPFLLESRSPILFPVPESAPQSDDRPTPSSPQLAASLSALIESTRDAIWSVDRQYCIVALNSAFRQQFLAAYGIELQAGMNLIECLPSEARSVWQGYYDRALAGDRFAVELHLAVSGFPSDVEVSFNPIVTPQGITGVAVFSRDVSERRRVREELQQAKDQLQAVLDAVPGCVSWFSADLNYIGVNHYLAATFNLEPEDFNGRRLGFMSSSPGFARFVREFFASSVKESTVEIAATVDGLPRSYLVAAQKYRQDQAAVFVGLDISDRRRFEEALRDSQERYALAMMAANDGLWDWNLKTNEIYFSPRWKAMLGYTESEIGHSPQEWFDRIHPEETEWVQTQIQTHLSGRSRHFEVEHRMRHKDGSYRWILSRGLAVRDGNRTAYRMAGSQTDITARKQAEEQLFHDALHDSLTGLANRTLFMDRLGQAIARRRRPNGQAFAVLVVDLDRFKVVNDSLGHSIGDQLLVSFARRLEGCVGAGDTIARLGGDEFAILLENIRDVNDAIAVAEQIQTEVRSPFNLNDQEVFSSVSIGIALSAMERNTAGKKLRDRPEDLLRNADTAMYRAKALGRARHELFNTAMYTRAVALLQLETDLRRAISGGFKNYSREFEVQYQPIVCLETREIIGFEALVRWRHPERGMISPAQFIPIAEDTGLIVPLGSWILSESCRQMAEWQTQFPDVPPLSISVNLSAKQFSQSDLLNQVTHLLQQAELNSQPLNLKLEITESALMDNPDAAIALLKEFKALGIQLLIDDFGTGYSSLSYLQRFPLDTVKIDRTFVSRMGSDGESDEIVRAIVNLSHNLGMNVIAEGVETAAQLDQLKEFDTEYGQGYFFAKSLTPQEVAKLLMTPHRYSMEVP